VGWSRSSRTDKSVHSLATVVSAPLQPNAAPSNIKAVPSPSVHTADNVAFGRKHPATTLIALPHPKEPACDAAAPPPRLLQVGMKMEVAADAFEGDPEGQRLAAAINAHLPPQVLRGLRVQGGGRGPGAEQPWEQTGSWLKQARPCSCVFATLPRMHARSPATRRSPL
jgi:hypothetical protein